MDFLKQRYICIIFSLVVIIGGITYGTITGYKFDIDFKGGTKIEVDNCGIDVCLTSSQKALGLPPGLSVCTFSEKEYRKYRYRSHF